MGGIPGAGFRLEVSLGGCTGLASHFDVAAKPEAADVVLESDGVRVFLSQNSYRMLEGATVDYVDSRIDSGFSIVAPNAPKACAGTPAALPAVATIEVHKIRHVG